VLLMDVGEAPLIILLLVLAFVGGLGIAAVGMAGAVVRFLREDRQRRR
jgi:hypothetical protein